MNDITKRPNDDLINSYFFEKFWLDKSPEHDAAGDEIIRRLEHSEQFNHDLCVFQRANPHYMPFEIWKSVRRYHEKLAGEL